MLIKNLPEFDHGFYCPVLEFLKLLVWSLDGARPVGHYAAGPGIVQPLPA